MASADSNRNWRYYLTAPRGARPMWFTLLFTGLFAPLAGFLLALYNLAIGWKPSAPGFGPAGGLVIMLFGAALLIGGIYLKRTNPCLGIVGLRAGNKEGKGPRP